MAHRSGRLARNRIQIGRRFLGAHVAILDHPHRKELPGLAIAREIARAHGGDIYAASAQGVTSFTVWIPQGPATPAAG